MSEGTSFDPDVTEPRPKKKSSTLKWVLIILGGLCFACCCIPGGFFAYVGFQSAPTTDAATIRARTSEIVDIQVPARLQPRSATKPLGQASFVIWGNGTGVRNGGLFIGESLGLPEEQLELNSQLQMDLQIAPPIENVSDRAEKTYTINGEQQTFELVKGTTSSGEKYVQLKGRFKGKQGPAILVLRLPEADYDEAEIDAMMNSMQ